MASGTDTIFIHNNKVPAGSRATYANTVCDYRPLLDEPYCVRLTVGDNILNYPGDPSTPAASLLDSKIILKSTISTPGVILFCADTEDYFLNNPMAHYEYMKTYCVGFPKTTLTNTK